MKKLLSIIFISIFLITVCVLEEILVKNTLNNINKNGIDLLIYADNFDNYNNTALLTKARELNQYWLNNEKLLCFFVNHKDMHEMGNELIKIISYAKNDIKEEFKTSLELVINYSSTFHHIMGVSFENIF